MGRGGKRDSPGSCQKTSGLATQFKKFKPDTRFNSTNFPQTEKSMYKQLSPDVETPGKDSEMTEVPEPELRTKEPRIPPIVVLNQKVSTISDIIKKVLNTHTPIKVTSFGTKVFVKSSEEYISLRKHLEEKHIHYYTHATPDDRTSKFVLYGLPA